MIELAEYALYQCCIDEGDDQTIYSFKILDDYRTSDGTGCIKNIKMALSKNACEKGYENLELQGNNTGTNVYNNEHDHDYDADDKWLQPKYCKDNDVLQLMVSIRSSSYMNAFYFKNCF